MNNQTDELKRDLAAFVAAGQQLRDRLSQYDHQLAALGGSPGKEIKLSDLPKVAKAIIAIRCVDECPEGAKAVYYSLDKPYRQF